MKRLTCLALMAQLLVLALVAAPATATRLEVHSDVTGAQITVQNRLYAESGPPPFFTDLPAGRYLLSVSATGRRLGYYALDIDTGVHLRSTRWSRIGGSAVLPGSGQWRDDGWQSGLTMAGSVASLLGRALYLNARAGTLREEAEAANVPVTDDLIRLGYDLEVYEASRDDYLFLTGAFYIGNLLDAAVRRGPIRFRETAPGVVTVAYRPTGVGQSMLLSALWPGLGQVRQGSVGRARIWNLFFLGTAFWWGEAQNNVEKARSDRNYFTATNSDTDPGYYEDLARLEANVNDKEAVSRIAIYTGIALWAYNIVDAALVTRRAVANSGEMVSNDPESSGWTFAPGLVGQSAGVVLGKKF